MSQDSAANTISVMLRVADPIGSASMRGASTFRLCVAFAAAFHVLLLIGFISAKPRRIGDPSGTKEAISVSLITEADLKARVAVEDKAAGVRVRPSAPVPTTAEPAPPPQSSPPTSEPITAQPAPDTAVEPQNQNQRTPTIRQVQRPPGLSQDKVGDSAQPKNPAPSIGSKQSGPDTSIGEPDPIKAPQTQTSKLHRAPPPVVFSTPSGGGGSGVQRPAGITRSRENDEFARGVIRALRRTMPQLRDTLGRVTVRITLDKNGNLSSTKVSKPSRVAGLDQSVVFSTHQSSFPLPPLNAKSVDLIFIVTYIYR